MANSLSVNLANWLFVKVGNWLSAVANYLSVKVAKQLPIKPENPLMFLSLKDENRPWPILSS